jgi:hypothetical protein
MFEKSVVFHYHFPLGSTLVSENQQEIHPILWVFVGFVQLFQIFSNFELWNDFA